MKIAALLLAGLLLFTGINAQTTDPEVEKRLAKADKLLEKGKDDEAEKILLDLANEYRSVSKVWNKLTEVQLAIYENKKKYDGLIGGNYTITTKDSTGKEVENDSLSIALAAMLGKFKPSDMYRDHLLNTCRVATCVSRYAHYPSVIIRTLLVDTATADIKKEAVKQFNLAEKEFQNKNYTQAANYYQKAIDMDSTFYKAKLYLGDVYYFTKHYDLATIEFRKAINTRPDLVEPRKYLIDALDKAGDHEKAFKEAVEAMMVYPDISLMYSLESQAAQSGAKNFDLHWIPRMVLPNSKTAGFNSKDDLKLEAPTSSYWKYYQEAFIKIKDRCNGNCILPAGDAGKHKYAELYAWEYMLSKSQSPDLAFAKKMQQQGYLDCYVFLSNFHYDIFDQYKDFIANNKEKIRGYFEVLKAMN